MQSLEMMSWSSYWSLFLFLGPMILPKLLQRFRRSRRSTQNTIRPVPAKVQRALNVLFAAAVIVLIFTLPYFAPENIFEVTESRLHNPTETLFLKLGNVRPLTAADDVLKKKFGSINVRMLYIHWGPETITSCLYCKPDDPESYFYHSIPLILAPHILNFLVICLATSPVVAGKEGARWRTQAVLTALAAVSIDLVLVSNYDFKNNSGVLRRQDLFYFFWYVRLGRLLVLAGLDAVLGYVMFLTSTNRWLVKPPTTAERLETTMKLLHDTTEKLGSLSAMCNTVYRDPSLRARHSEYWAREGDIMEEVMAEEDVRTALNEAVTESYTQSFAGRAEEMTDGIMTVAGLRAKQHGE